MEDSLDVKSEREEENIYDEITEDEGQQVCEGLSSMG